MPHLFHAALQLLPLGILEASKSLLLGLPLGGLLLLPRETLLLPGLILTTERISSVSTTAGVPNDAVGRTGLSTLARGGRLLEAEVVLGLEGIHLLQLVEGGVGIMTIALIVVVVHLGTVDTTLLVAIAVAIVITTLQIWVHPTLVLDEIEQELIPIAHLTPRITDGGIAGTQLLERGYLTFHQLLSTVGIGLGQRLLHHPIVSIVVAIRSVIVVAVIGIIHRRTEEGGAQFSLLVVVGKSRGRSVLILAAARRGVAILIVAVSALATLSTLLGIHLLKYLLSNNVLVFHWLVTLALLLVALPIVITAVIVVPARKELGILIVDRIIPILKRLEGAKDAQVHPRRHELAVLVFLLAAAVVLVAVAAELLPGLPGVEQLLPPLALVELPGVFLVHLEDGRGRVGRDISSLFVGRLFLIVGGVVQEQLLLLTFLGRWHILCFAHLVFALTGI
mmetsp:Transcript_12942/g.36930  ORF Transcript_12942/g.36930 Transcript_12942/m.36930 type:complete len:450 (+) Transcript_12942:1102-2451(+)